MAEAVLSIFPDAKFGIGPNIEDGFYYDFDLPRNLTPEDLPVIEKKMKELIKARLPFVRKDVSKEEARQIFAAQPYKLELIDEIEDEAVSVVENEHTSHRRVHDSHPSARATAKRHARALRDVSSSSRSGMLSATMPAPARPV